MNTRFYIPHSKSLPPWRWLASLEDARRIANAIAVSGEEATIHQVLVDGPPTEVLLSLHRWENTQKTNGDMIPNDGYFTATPYERHEPSEQIPLPAPHPDVWEVRVVDLRPEGPKPKKKPGPKPKKKGGKK